MATGFRLPAERENGGPDLQESRELDDGLGLFVRGSGGGRLSRRGSRTADRTNARISLDAVPKGVAEVVKTFVPSKKAGEKNESLDDFRYLSPKTQFCDRA
jgi:hypothetical protein